MAPGLLRAVAAAAVLGGAEGLRSRAEDACTCRAWKDTYTNAGVACGQTNEYFLATGRSSVHEYERHELAKHLGDEFCTHFYETIVDNFCVNINTGADRGQWCFVDAACSDLAGGEKVNDKVSWKKCSAGKDRMLRQYNPPALAQLAKEQNLDLGLLNKMSYPLNQARWKYISSYWGGHMDEITTVPAELGQVSLADLKDYLKPRWGHRGREIDAEMTKELKAIADSGVPTTFDTAKDHHPPHVIVQNRTAWVVLPNLKPTLMCVYNCKH